MKPSCLLVSGVLALVAIASPAAAFQNPNTSNIMVTSADGSVSVLPPLVADTDSRPAIQSAIDWCEATPGRETLRIPPGVWKVAASVELVGDVDYQCEMVDLTPLDPATFQRAVVFAGAAGHPSGGGTRVRADKVSITGLTIRQTAATSQHCHCLFSTEGDDWKLTRVKAIGSKHEGLVSGGARWLWDHCEAEDCGAGSEHRGQSGAGLNCNGRDHTLIKCITRRCGQGFEHAGYRTTFIECEALDGNTQAGPCYGFNLGNGVIGLYRARLLGCKSTGHPAAVVVGNVIGRCGGILVENFDSTEGSILFAGGLPTNSVPTEDQGPDLERSAFIRCTVRTAKAEGMQCFAASSGGDPLLGRASVDFIDCTAEVPAGEPDWMANAPFQVSGPWSGDAVFLRPVLKGPRGASKAQGDFWLGGTLQTSQPNVKCLFGKAFKADGTERWFHPFRGATE